MINIRVEKILLMIYKIMNGWEIRVYEADQRDYSSMRNRLYENKKNKLPKLNSSIYLKKWIFWKLYK